MRNTTSTKSVILPNNETIHSTHDAKLNIPNVNKAAKAATVYPNLTSSSLISIGQLCDDNCTAIFTKENMRVVKDDNIVLEGERNLNDGLWDVNMADNT